MFCEGGVLKEVLDEAPPEAYTPWNWFWGACWCWLCAGVVGGAKAMRLNRVFLGRKRKERIYVLGAKGTNEERVCSK